MTHSESTCWTVVRAAAAGSPADRDELARRYLAVVRAYLAARWRGSDLRRDLEDAVQEVFIECFRAGGAVEAAGAGRVPHFRAFLYGVARRFEGRPRRPTAPLPAEERAACERLWADVAALLNKAETPARKGTKR